MNLVVKIVSAWKPLTFSTKNSILDVWEGSEYASELCKYLRRQKQPFSSTEYTFDKLLAENLLRRIFFYKIAAWQSAAFSKYEVPSEVLPWNFGNFFITLISQSNLSDSIRFLRNSWPLKFH